uniref:Uncharacterized protein n=1 Tax=Anguilla anguilla TaxID=7936 RepID=A0A0E9TFU0_ANGAN
MGEVCTGIESVIFELEQLNSFFFCTIKCLFCKDTECKQQ